jgi:hypothetical protein
MKSADFRLKKEKGTVYTVILFAVIFLLCIFLVYKSKNNKNKSTGFHFGRFVNPYTVCGFVIEMLERGQVDIEEYGSEKTQHGAFSIVISRGKDIDGVNRVIESYLVSIKDDKEGNSEDFVLAGVLYPEDYYEYRIVSHRKNYTQD